MNGLATATSPYLRQHAGNPVAWRPWSPEAFAEARARDVPVLVSIGYSTCHWCHVMAHESFEDPATAAVMNRLFVCIKVDREEHPEVDAIYMDAVQALTGRGGWPLNAFTDADGRPFYAMTYAPRAQWTQLIQQLAQVWTGDRGRITQACTDITAHLRTEDDASSGALDNQVWQRLDQQIATSYDAEHPGFTWGQGREPKFPPSQLLHLLLDRDPARASAVLEAMQDGGIHDRVGGGFHRYSVDRAWRVPHFEKMLYDNAQLMAAYARAALALGRADFARTAANTADYLLRDLRVYAQGRFVGYAAAEDADDPGGEGSFYAWSPDQLVAALGSERAAQLIQAWNITAGEAEIGPSGHAEPVASHIPHPRGSGLDLAPLRAGWEDLLPVLRAHRAVRPRPGLDDKVLTDQNGLALEGFAWVYRATGEARYRDACRELAGVLAERHTGDGLLRLPGRPAVVTDYGALAGGLLAAFDALGDAQLVHRAAAIVDEAVARLAAPDGGFFTAPAGRADLLRRGRDHLDNAWPSGQALLAWSSARLWTITGDDRWRGRAQAALAAAAAMVNRAPAASATNLRTQALLQHGHASVVVAGSSLLPVARSSADAALAIIPLDACRQEPWSTLAGRHDLTGEVALVCRGEACLLPAGTAAELRERLQHPAVSG